jgi:hypothetical protein
MGSVGLVFVLLLPGDQEDNRPTPDIELYPIPAYQRPSVLGATVQLNEVWSACLEQALLVLRI